MKKITLKAARRILTGNPMLSPQEAFDAAYVVLYDYVSAPRWLRNLAIDAQNEIYISGALDAKDHNRRILEIESA